MQTPFCKDWRICQRVNYSVAESHHFDAALGENFDLAPDPSKNFVAAPAPRENFITATAQASPLSYAS
jgi:hypothetical protein